LLHVAEDLDEVAALGNEEHLARQAAKIRRLRGFGVEQVLHVEISDDVVERALLRDDQARVAVLAKERGRALEARAHRNVNDVDAREHRVPRGALRKSEHALDELALLAPARRS